MPPAGEGDRPQSATAAKAEVNAGADLNFQTESAAELYFKQGMYREALAIYKGLFEKTGRNDNFMEVKAILMLQRGERSNRVIARLEKFLQLAQQRGKQIV
jgi:tetratricopeptide (TPR) repeat protein